jgi:hypothetical protein
VQYSAVLSVIRQGKVRRGGEVEQYSAGEKVVEGRYKRGGR